jgi:hypothetical protein
MPIALVQKSLVVMWKKCRYYVDRYAPNIIPPIFYIGVVALGLELKLETQELNE